MKCSSTILRRLSTTLAATGIAAACALSANAQQLNYLQSAGFYSGGLQGGLDAATETSHVNPPNGPSSGFFPPINGFGGLEFFTAAGATPFPALTWKQIAWGCVSNQGPPPTPAQCANGGTLGNLAPAGVFNAGAAGRSSLEVLGQTGTIDTANWADITKVVHHNHVLNGYANSLDAVDVSSFLRFIVPPGNPANGTIIDVGGSITTVDFSETDNLQATCAPPLPGLQGNPVGSSLGTQCDDFAFVSGLDLTSLLIPPGLVGNATFLQVNFRLTAGSGSLVCGALAAQPQSALCNGYMGSDLLIYTAEGGDNDFTIQAQLSPNITVPLFVIGDCEWDQWRPHSVAPPFGNGPGQDNNLREVDDEVNFWGSQWWKNNCMDQFVSNGYPAFKGFATNAVVNPTGSPNCGQWQARPGNSGNPPDTIPNTINIIVTDNVIKQGPNIGGNIKQIVQVTRSRSNNDNYAGNPGHQGWGKIDTIVCGPPA